MCGLSNLRHVALLTVTSGLNRDVPSSHQAFVAPQCLCQMTDSKTNHPRLNNQRQTPKRAQYGNLGLAKMGLDSKKRGLAPPLTMTIAHRASVGSVLASTFTPRQGRAERALLTAAGNNRQPSQVQAQHSLTVQYCTIRGRSCPLRWAARFRQRLHLTGCYTPADRLRKVVTSMTHHYEPPTTVTVSE